MNAMLIINLTPVSHVGQFNYVISATRSAYGKRMTMSLPYIYNRQWYGLKTEMIFLDGG